MDNVVSNDTCEARMSAVKDGMDRMEDSMKVVHAEIKEMGFSLNNVERAMELSAQSMKQFIDATDMRFAKSEENAHQDRRDFKDIMTELAAYFKMAREQQVVMGKAVTASQAKPKFNWNEFFRSKAGFVIVLCICLSTLVILCAAIAPTLLPEVIKIFGGV